MSESITQGDLKLFQTSINWSDIKCTIEGFVILDDGIENTILISLGTNRRADETDTLPASENDKQGWWGDSLDLNNRKIGSKYWLRQRSKRTPTLLEELLEDTNEALQHMLDDNIVDSFENDVTIDKFNPNNVLIFVVSIKNKIKTGYDYYYNWKNQILGRVV